MRRITVFYAMSDSQCGEVAARLPAGDALFAAAYPASAEALDAVLITCDAKRAVATGPRCRFELVA